MENQNKYGLKRYIRPAIKRLIRENSGFGCVICGGSDYTYEHIDPEFNDADAHDPNKMTLLCFACHGKVTTKKWSKEKVKQAMAAPFRKAHGYVIGKNKEEFDFGFGQPYIIIGDAKLENCLIPLAVNSKPLFKIISPVAKGYPFQLSGILNDSNGVPCLYIENNKWYASQDIWDIVVEGAAITIRERMGKIHLR